MLSRGRIKYTLRSKYQIPSYTSKLLRDILKIIQTGLKIISKPKANNFWYKIDQGLHCT